VEWPLIGGLSDRVEGRTVAADVLAIDGSLLGTVVGLIAVDGVATTLAHVVALFRPEMSSRSRGILGAEPAAASGARSRRQRTDGTSSAARRLRLMSDEPLTPMTEAQEQFAARLTDDLGRILGAGILIEELELGDASGGTAKIRVLCLFDGGTQVLEADGETSFEAYGRLVRAAAEMRLAIATRNMIAPT
jgi:hypothetical protein